MSFRTYVLLLSVLYLGLAAPAQAAEWVDYCFWGAGGKLEYTSAPTANATNYKYGRGRPMDVKHIKLDLNIDLVKETLEGTATTTFSPIGKEMSVVVFDAVNLDVTSVTDGSGVELDYYSTENTLEVTLSSPATPDADVTLVISYSAKPARGMHFRSRRMGYKPSEVNAWSQGEPEDNRHWFPSFDYPNERATSEIIATVDERYTALSNGVLVETKDAPNGRKTFHWRQSVPHPSYLISLVVGEYTSTTEPDAVVPLHYFVRPEFAKDAHLSFGKTDSMMRFFQDWIGIPYPYESYSQVAVVDFIFGGMENSSITTLTERTLHDEAAHLTYSSDGLVAHELAHQWWGDLLTCRDWSHLWLNEGFATYFQALYFEHDRGKDAFDYAMLTNREHYLDMESEDNRIPVIRREYDDANDAINRRVYTKGSWVLHMLRRRLGDDLFQRCIREYGKRHQGSPVESSDLMRTIEEVSGEGMEEFFDHWLYKAGYPDLDVSYSWDDESHSAKVVVKQKQKVDSLTPIFHFPVDIAFATKGEIHTERVEVSEIEHTFYLPLETRPDYVRFDPNGDILCALAFKKPKPMLLAQLVGSNDILGRIEAIEGLADNKTQDVVDALELILSDDSFWGVRVRAAAILGKLDNDNATDVLRTGLKQSDARVRVAVAKALANRKGEDAGPALVKVIENDESPYVVAAAIRALGTLDYTQATKLIKKSMSRASHNGNIRSATFDALIDLKAESSISDIRPYASRSKPRNTRRDAVLALGELAKWSSDKTEAREALVDILDDPSTWIRSGAISALGNLGDVQAIPALERFAESTGNPREAKRAQKAIEAIRKLRGQTDEFKTLRDDVKELKKSRDDLLKRLDALEHRAEESSKDDEKEEVEEN